MLGILNEAMAMATSKARSFHEVGEPGLRSQERIMRWWVLA